MDRIEKALFAPGRHIFIYGDRGVGKSSLAATAASQYQSADSDYIDVSCSPEATLSSVVANIAYQATSTSRLVDSKVQKSISGELKYFKFSGTTFTAQKDLSKEIKSLLDAVEVLREVTKIHSEKPIVVIDEFDRLDSDVEKTKFADLVKHLGDKRIGIKFIFTGVGKTLDHVLGSHASAIRQFETIELPKLNWEARWVILLQAAAEFGIEVPKDIYVRVAAVSDGYPYYVHLMTEKMLWKAFEDQRTITKLGWDHYNSGLQDAIASISAELKRPYELAINQRSEDYEEVLWSTADSEWLQRYVKDMYASYEYVMKQFPDKTVLTYQLYSSRIRALKKPTCGGILVPESKSGLYSYREKMLRGYVRMQAEAHGVELIGEADKERPRHTIPAPARASTGYYQSIVPSGVNLGRKRNNGGDK